jgi:hypothetical protein
MRLLLQHSLLFQWQTGCWCCCFWECDFHSRRLLLLLLLAVM